MWLHIKGNDEQFRMKNKQLHYQMKFKMKCQNNNLIGLNVMLVLTVN